MTRAERRRLETAGARKEPVYTLTQTQINEIRRQAVLERKEELKASISREIDEHIQRDRRADPEGVGRTRGGADRRNRRGADPKGSMPSSGSSGQGPL